MMKLYSLPLGAYQTNCYIVHEEGSAACAIIDPGDDPDTLLRALKQLELTVDAILLTHGHFDHVGAVEELVKATGCRLWMSESDWSQSPASPHACYFPLANRDFTEVWFCEDGEEIRAGGLSFTTLSTPGHTSGSVCYLCGDALFSGDTLFAGSCGRTDLGGSWEALTRSLKRLASLEENLKVYPGHGESTTLAREKRYNPYLR